MKKPNFFIIGAPKCGTTSLAEWLRGHPEVFVTDPKEPLWFNTDVGFRSTLSWDEYNALFVHATNDHSAIGEASTSYLWSRSAIPRILEYNPKARFIVMLRFPPEMAMAMHAQECGGGEDVCNFEQAWRLQRGRASGHHLPAFCRAPDLYQYGERCSTGTQLERLLYQVTSEKVLVVFLEEMAADPASQWRRVINFLGLEKYHMPEFAIHNSRRSLRSFTFKQGLNAIGYLKRTIGLKRNFGILAPFYRLNTSHDAPKQGLDDLSPSLRLELAEYFKEEIIKIRRHVGYVPTEWERKWRSMTK